MDRLLFLVILKGIDSFEPCSTPSIPENAYLANLTPECLTESVFNHKTICKFGCNSGYALLRVDGTVPDGETTSWCLKNINLKYQRKRHLKSLIIF